MKNSSLYIFSCAGVRTHDRLDHKFNLVAPNLSKNCVSNVLVLTIYHTQKALYRVERKEMGQEFTFPRNPKA